jgi:hypothetical protein
MEVPHEEWTEQKKKGMRSLRIEKEAQTVLPWLTPPSPEMNEEKKKSNVFFSGC